MGNERIRGISGGERRRLTLGEMLMTWSSIACWDEISTGCVNHAGFDCWGRGVRVTSTRVIRSDSLRLNYTQPTHSLDAAATHDIVLMTRAVVKAFKTTCIVSLLQVRP